MKRSDFSRTTSQPATARAFQTAMLYPAVSGIIKKVNVDLGDRVKAGQVLAEIAAPELESELELSQAVVEKARAQVVLGQTRIKVAQAAVQMAGARDDQDREAGIQEARAKVETAEAELMVAKAELAVAEAGLLKAETRLGVTRITSPFEGVVIQPRMQRRRDGRCRHRPRSLRLS